MQNNNATTVGCESDRSPTQSHPINIRDLTMMVRKQKSRRQRNLRAFTPPSLTKLNRKRKRANSKKHPASIFVDIIHPYLSSGQVVLGYYTNVPIDPLSNAPYSNVTTTIPFGYKEVVRNRHFTKSQNCDKMLPNKTPPISPSTKNSQN